MGNHCAWRPISQTREDNTPKMFILLLPGFFAALSAFFSSQTSPVTALVAENMTSSRLKDMDNLSAANTVFALNLFKQLSANDPFDNLFFSPLSMSSALQMALFGAKDGEVHQRFEKSIADVNKPDANYSLSLVNQLFGETSYDFLASFIESTQRFYYVGLEKLNFTKASEDSRRHINAWVEEKISGKIQDLLSPGIINPLTKLVLVNAMYFKGNWAEKFNKRHTKEKPFWINKNERKTVQMMFRKGKYNIGHISDYQTTILEIPFTDNEFSMFVLLPDEIENNSTGLEKMEREITHEKLMDWINPENMVLTEIELCFPKFKLEEKYDLKLILKSMGMTDAFDEGKADFSGMSTNNDLAISEVVHKAFIEVNEEGTESAAATGVLRALKSTNDADELVVDHPFIFSIIKQPSKSIMSFGRYRSP